MAAGVLFDGRHEIAVSAAPADDEDELLARCDGDFPANIDRLLLVGIVFGWILC